jgi:hypothetical protein
VKGKKQFPSNWFRLGFDSVEERTTKAQRKIELGFDQAQKVRD